MLAAHKENENAHLPIAAFFLPLSSSTYLLHNHRHDRVQDTLMAVLCLFAVGVVTALCAIFMMFAIKRCVNLTDLDSVVFLLA